MIRELMIFAERVGPFFLPFALYFAYLAMTRAWPPGRTHPWMLLTIAGLLCVAGGFFVWRFTSVEPTTGLYVAPHVANGKIVPGYVEPAPEKTK